jgi:hypothetical protein
MVGFQRLPRIGTRYDKLARNFFSALGVIFAASRGGALKRIVRSYESMRCKR